MVSMSFFSFAITYPCNLLWFSTFIWWIKLGLTKNNTYWKQPNNAVFDSGRKYHKYELLSQKFCSVHLPTLIYYSELPLQLWLWQTNCFVWSLFCGKRWLETQQNLQPDCQLSVYYWHLAHRYVHSGNFGFTFRRYIGQHYRMHPIRT